MKRVACIAMSDRTHFSSMLAVASELVRAGATVGFWTDAAFRTEVEAAGCEFCNLFDPVSVDEVDDASIPQPSRFVTFAAVCGVEIPERIGRWHPDLVVRAGFAYVGEVVAKRLDLPCVVLASGHADLGAEFRSRLAMDARVRTDPRCLAAVDHLRAEFGLADASPFSYVADPSPLLTIYKEPEEWLSLAERAIYGPLACFGSLQTVDGDGPRTHTGRTRIYVSFGTVVWRYWGREVLAALHAVADAATLLDDVEMVVGLGNRQISPDAMKALERPGVAVHPYADQWHELGRADLFVTHHGLGSTHEAVARGVPMLSYPIFWDQPALAERSRQFGIALPLAERPLDPLTPPQVADAIAAAVAQRDAMVEHLTAARDWERRTIANRPETARQILSVSG